MVTAAVVRADQRTAAQCTTPPRHDDTTAAVLVTVTTCTAVPHWAPWARVAAASAEVTPDRALPCTAPSAPRHAPVPVAVAKEAEEEDAADTATWASFWAAVPSSSEALTEQEEEEELVVVA